MQLYTYKTLRQKILNNILFFGEKKCRLSTSGHVTNESRVPEMVAPRVCCRRSPLPSPRRSSSRRRGEAFIAQRTVIWWRKRRQNEQRLYSTHTGATSFFPHYFQSKSLYLSLAMSYLYLCNCADLFHPWKYEKTTSNVNTLAKLQECSVLTGWAKSKIMFHKNSSPLDLFTMTLLSVL